jgi:peptide/nickel transport system substrate-binding protein
VLTVGLVGLDKVTQAIAGQLEKVGVTLDITTKPAVGDYFTSMVGGEFPAAAIGYGLANMATLHAGFVNPAGPFNFFHTDDPKLTALYNEYFAADEDDSAALQKQINKYLTEQAWAVPVVGSPLSYYLVDGLTGLDATSSNAGVPRLTELRPTN